ncbi:unnamed protein product [Cyprideis torosa]|uniref:Uncharacterized protein n=1 Tax=Cyprideis torosa TaxID=163714 RepID=A0A7R8ZU63_9CRUS|nr:unnamed protein product [Cyprideis torosa]CAG0905373.1 unnamed protein product [Cyprideis torosa]
MWDVGSGAVPLQFTPDPTSHVPRVKLVWEDVRTTSNHLLKELEFDADLFIYLLWSNPKSIDMHSGRRGVDTPNIERMMPMRGILGWVPMEQPPFGWVLIGAAILDWVGERDGYPYIGCRYQGWDGTGYASVLQKTVQWCIFRPESRKIDSCRVRRKSAASMTSTKDVGEDAVVPAELEEEKEEDLMKEEDERKKQEEEKMKQEEEKKKQEEERKQQGEEMKRKQEQEKEQKRKEEQEKKEKEEEQKQEEQRKREEEERLKQEEDSDSDWEPEIGKTNWEEMRQNVKAERKKTDVKAALEDEDFKEFSEWIFSGEDDVKNVGQKMKFNI